MAHDMQRRINHRDMFACAEVIEKYKKPKAQKYVYEYIQKKAVEEMSLTESSMSQEEQLSRKMFSFLYKFIGRKDNEKLLNKQIKKLTEEKLENKLSSLFCYIRNK